MNARARHLLAALGMCMLASPLFGVEPPPLSVPSSPSYGAADSTLVPDRDMLTLVNQARSQAGLSPLAWDDRLAQAARQHAELLVAHRTLSHQLEGEAPLERRVEAVNLPVKTVGENVAVHFDPADAHAAFMNSPGHKANILNPDFDAVGIAAVRDGDLVYFVEDFAHRRTVLSNTDATQVLTRALDGLRSRSGLPALPQVDDSRVQAWACADADNDQLSRTEGMALPGVALAVAFSSADPGQLPGELAKLATVPASHYSLGVCYAQTPRYANGRYFVTIAFFSNDPVQPQSVLSSIATQTGAVPLGLTH